MGETACAKALLLIKHVWGKFLHPHCMQVNVDLDYAHAITCMIRCLPLICFYVCECLYVCVYVHVCARGHVCACGGQKKVPDPMGIVTYGYNPPGGCWELNLSPVEEQPVRALNCLRQLSTPLTGIWRLDSPARMAGP